MFYIIQLLFLLFHGNPGNGGGRRACETPNPPFWCENQTEPGEYIIGIKSRTIFNINDLLTPLYSFVMEATNNTKYNFDKY
jgi:hypothetical protein